MKWDVWNAAQIDETEVAACRGEAGLSALVATVLWARGVRSAKEMLDFLSDDLETIQDPMELAGMAEGIARIRQAIQEREKVAIYGDYDVDGITATALLADYLGTKGLDCAVYIPDRLGEGYGLNLGALQSLKEQGVTLVITVDCGVTAIDEVLAARDLGLDMIITDHHQCYEELPAAVAVIDPQRPDCMYTEKGLSGVGVAFQCILAVEGAEHIETLLDRYADLVAVGTIADVMELCGQNRLLVSRGVEALKKGKRPGFAALLKEAGIDNKTISASGVGYGLGPRLNAAGRMGDAMAAYALLTTEDKAEAEALAQELCELNQKRQKIEQEITEAALHMLEEEDYTGGPIVLASENWHKGVLGIVSARLMERYREPVILLSVEGGVGRGSCRGIPGFDLFAALTACESLLETFGGHQQAAGLTVSMEAFGKFKETFRAYYETHPPTADANILQADFILTDPNLISLDQVNSLERLEPCGKGNPSPLLILEGAKLLKVQPIGGGKHVKLQVEKWGKGFDCVYFGMEASALGAVEGDTIDLAFTPQCNSFRGRTTVQFLIRDIARTARRETEHARRICSSLLDGTVPTAAEVKSITPAREDFVRLWRRLSQGTAKLQGRIDQVLDDLAPSGTSWGKTYLCLRVFDELGLAHLEEQADLLQIEVSQQAEKVDLAASRVLSALTGATE